jgi:hypothetical protein
MPIEIDLPEDILLKIKTDRELEKMIKKRIEKDISEDIKEDIFLSMLFDRALEHSELTQKDIDETDRKVKKGISEGLGWK